MKVKILGIFIINLLLWGTCLGPVFALEHTQKNGLFSMDVPEGWHWVEYPQEIIITYPDGNTMAIDIQLMPSRKHSQTEIKKAIKEADDKMIKQGIEAHSGVLLDDKEIKLDGIYAIQLDFKTAPPNTLHVTYVSFFNKGYVFTITYGSGDDKIHSVMDDVVGTFKFR